MSLTYKLERGKKHNEDGITLARNRTGKGGLEAERVGYYMLLLPLHLKSKVSTCFQSVFERTSNAEWTHTGCILAAALRCPV